VAEPGVEAAEAEVRPEDLAALENEMVATIRRARLGSREQARALHPALDPTAFPLVVLLGRNGELRMSELAEALSLDKSTVTRQVDAVVRLGLAERASDPQDARVRIVRLTPDGREKVLALLDGQRARWRAALGTWDRGDVVELTRLLHQLGNAGVI
jgi:DNA-binding MarR family transcriptional regulator